MHGLPGTQPHDFMAARTYWCQGSTSRGEGSPTATGMPKSAKRTLICSSVSRL